jgi:opacity protein-like surface antigen
MGGPTYTYTLRDFRRLRFYGKGMIGFGGINFPPYGSYSHDTRTIWAPGFGAEYRAWNSFWVRADYEYQYWPNLFGRGNTLNPHGLTIGMVYDFSTVHRKY